MRMSRFGVRMVLAGTAAFGLLGVLPLTAQAAQGQTGYDISYPQCGATTISTPQSTGAFDILGVNDGIVYSANPCLGAEYTWAKAVTVSFYANTANPGPSSSHWPRNQTVNGVYCPDQKRYTVGSTAYNNCSYGYGYNAAKDSYTDAVNAVGASAASSAQWWLDVESANSWTRSYAANIADIQGGLDYFAQNKVSGDGIYTNSSSWSSVTGSTRQFASYPWWYPTGQSSAVTAANDCTATSILGGHIRYTQYLSGGFDTDYDCG